MRVSGGWPALRTREGWRALAPRLRALRGVPIAAIGAVLAWHNYARFGSPFEFGHRFLNVQWQERISRFGLFNYHFLSRNLAAALVLLPRIMTHAPFVKISQHGMSLLVTSPNLAYTVMPPGAQPPHASRSGSRSLATAIPSLLYQNSGYIQFGYRFSLDYMIYFVVLLAIGNRPLSRALQGRSSSSPSRSTCSWRSSSIATWSSRTTTRSSRTATTEARGRPGSRADGRRAWKPRAWSRR